jgi:hypothetical protein
VVLACVNCWPGAEHPSEPFWLPREAARQASTIDRLNG